jgi:hypothetical protein
MFNEKCCGNCNYHEPQDEDVFVCVCEDSEGYGLETAYDDCCEEHEEKE